MFRKEADLQSGSAACASSSPQFLPTASCARANNPRAVAIGIACEGHLQGPIRAGSAAVHGPLCYGMAVHVPVRSRRARTKMPSCGTCWLQLFCRC